MTSKQRAPSSALLAVPLILSLLAACEDASGRGAPADAAPPSERGASSDGSAPDTRASDGTREGAAPAPGCGNGQLDPGEACDGSDLGGATCQDLLDFTGGTLACTARCQLDSSGCTGKAPAIDLAAAGFLDVTTLGADPTGAKDSTAAIQQAVEQARDAGKAAFFPTGTYLVSDTIRCMKKTTKNAAGKWIADDHACFIVGSGRGRPLIQLKAGAAGFGDKANPKPVFWLWSMPSTEELAQRPECEGSTDPICEQSNISFNMVIKGLDLDLGRNPGAVGIRHAGAQGATIEDVKVLASGAYAGIYNPPGQAGGTYNVEIVEGDYGIVTAKVAGRTQAKFTLIAGAVLRNQVQAPFRIDLPHPMVVVGFHIVRSAAGPINSGLPTDGLNLIDGVLDLAGGQAVSGTDRPLYLRDVHVRGASSIASSWTVSDPGAWTRVEEYSLCAGGFTDLVQGVTSCAERRAKVEGLQVSGDDLGLQLVRRHVWDDRASPHAEAAGVINVKDAAQMNGAPAKGDGSSDDTAALEYAVAHADKVFLPKGSYVLRRTLLLGKRTQLFGAGRIYSSLVSAGTWDSSKGDALVDTVDDAGATSSLSHLRLASTRSLSWRAGRRSLVRSLNAGVVKISGHGGGRWPALFQTGRQLTIEGTSEPLMLYGTNPERAADPQWRIVNASNVQIFYLKSETGLGNGSYSTSLRVEGSHHVAVHGVTGNLTMASGQAVLDLVDSDDVVVTHVHPFNTSAGWSLLRSKQGAGAPLVVAGDKKLGLFKLGSPAL